ncbi:MAG: hypothetical protein GWO02_16240, partial [Gammaproteobacteria bacterium]|nr:hypothetical protein [Gammaproteobacteria bacterium]
MLVPAAAGAQAPAAIPGMAPEAVTLGSDIDGDGDPDEVEIVLEIAEAQEE